MKEIESQDKIDQLNDLKQSLALKYKTSLKTLTKKEKDKVEVKNNITKLEQANKACREEYKNKLISIKTTDLKIIKLAKNIQDIELTLEAISSE